MQETTNNALIINNRNLTYDFIRTVAIVFVVFIHSMGLVNYGVKDGILEAKYVDAFLNIIYTAVPLFVMLSGALLLGKKESILTFYKKRFSRVLVPFFVWSLIVGAILFFQDGGRTLSSFAIFELKGITTSGVHGIYWYVYMIIGLYLLTPILRLIVQSNNNLYGIYYLTGLSICICLFNEYLPTVMLFSKMFSDNLIHLFYFLIGYILVENVNKYKERIDFLRLSFILFCITYLINAILKYNGFVIMWLRVLQCITLFVFLLSIRIDNVPKIISNLIKKMSRYSYGIYLSHFMLISVALKFQEIHSIPLSIEPFIMVLIVLTASITMFFVFEKIHIGKYVM